MTLKVSANTLIHMGNVLCLDCETTVSSKGNAFDQTNKLVCIGVKWINEYSDVYIKYEDFLALQYSIDKANIIVGFNIKFDLHWLRKVGIDISKVRVWDCQLAEFILGNQSKPYPSLNDAATKYGLSSKLDIVKEQYWDKGIDTDKIPRNVLDEYLTQDLNLTQQVYEKQLEQFKNEASGLFPLFKLQCQDLLVLEDMEFNGIKFNSNSALTKAKEIGNELETISKTLSVQVGGIPFNPSSNDHISCLLYGGTITDDMRIPVGVYKTGEKTGQTRYKIVPKLYTLPRLVEPIKGTEVKKGGYWEVNETVLRKLKLNKEAKKVVDLLNQHAKLDKLRGTYLEGYSKLIQTMNWEQDTLHGTLNQCVAITGRLSSSKPNLQNADSYTKYFMRSRYDRTG